MHDAIKKDKLWYGIDTTIIMVRVISLATCYRNQHTLLHTWDVVYMVILGLEIRQDHFETLQCVIDHASLYLHIYKLNRRMG